MKMATENRKNAAEQRLAARQHYIAEHVQALPIDWQTLDEVHLQAFVQDLHQQLAKAEETRYDLEMTIRRQDYQVRPSSPCRRKEFSALRDQRINHSGERHQRQIHQTNLEENLPHRSEVRNPLFLLRPARPQSFPEC